MVDEIGGGFRRIIPSSGRSRRVKALEPAQSGKPSDEGNPSWYTERRRGRNERRHRNSRVLVDMRSGRDRRRARGGKGIDLKV